MYKNIKQKMVILGAFILGILISIYVKSLDNTNTYMTLDEKKEMENKIQKTKDEIVRLKTINLEYKNKLDYYNKAVGDSTKSIVDLVTIDLNNLKRECGFSLEKGEGVKIIIKDSEKDLKSNQNPNDLIVHDIDILRIINDLKKSGAMSIAINGERLLPLSKIKCSGATITVNDTTYGQPFIIEAIGDKETLAASVISPESYANLLKEGYGIYIKVEAKDYITINSYKKS